MEADFSGWVTKAGLKCTDGRTIMPGAFKHQDKAQVPLVWQHGHNDPENVLGHVLLEDRGDEGVYGYGFFNTTNKANHTKNALEHNDFNMMSIWANQLVERAKAVLHGAIREVSLVLSGANPGAVIESVTIRHSDDDLEVLEDEAIIRTGEVIEHATSDGGDGGGDGEDETVEDVVNSMSEKQKQVLYYMVGVAASGEDTMAQSDLGHAVGEGDDEDETLQDVFDSMTEKQQQVLHYMVGAALGDDGADGVEHSGLNDDGNDNKSNEKDDQKGTEMKHNVFESGNKDEDKKHVLSHDDMATIVKEGKRRGSLKAAVEDYAEEHLEHGINDIDVLFPEAKLVGDAPEWVSRRMEWVGELLGGIVKSPFSRIKTISADLTYDEARAKGYVKGSLKKEEYFGVAKRVTTPTTIYKKQSLDRDDILDITDFNVVAWLKAEMRIMLDEELARAILIGDGRDVSHEDKINEGNIRPIAKDHELYTTTVTVNVDDANSTMREVVDAVTVNRYLLKGTGQPNFYTTEYWIGKFLTLRDADNRREYKNIDEVATDLRVGKVVAVEVMLDEPDIVGILVNPVDYRLGMDRGGEVNFFDDFDIDYNKEKYLIETRCSGALTKIKSAMVIRRTAGANVVVAPAMPTFDAEAGELTIVNQTGVVYRNADTNAVINAAGSPYSVASGDTINVVATPASGYYFATSEADSWSFTAD